jgi:hypothetical protein
MKKSPLPPRPCPPTAGKPERWHIDAGDADVATLVIPADSFRTRHFEIDCRLVVKPLAAGARHGMRVDVDGGLEWTRRRPPRTRATPIRWTTTSAASCPRACRCASSSRRGEAGAPRAAVIEAEEQG